MNGYDDPNLRLLLNGPAIEEQQINVYDLGTILISIQRLFGAITGFELTRSQTPFIEIRDRVLDLPPFLRQNVVQVKFRQTSQGSLIVDLTLGLAYEVYRFFQNHPITTSFVTSILANFFTSAALAVGRQRVRGGGIALPGELNDREREDLSFRTLPMLTALANKIDRRSGVESIEFRGSVTPDRVEWEFVLDRTAKNQISRYADSTVAPLAEYRGILGELSLFTRTGRIRNSFDDTLQEIAIPNPDMCEKMAHHLNEEVSILAQVDVTRDVETRRLRTKYIVHDFEPLQKALT